MFGIGMNLGQVADVLGRLETKKTRFHPELCMRIRHRAARCTRCIDSCPRHAVAWNGLLETNADLCAGCGSCSTVCPTGAIEALVPTNQELEARVQARIAETSTVVFACPTYLKTHKTRPEEVLVVNCLARLDESVFVGAVAAGAQSIVLLEGACERCEFASGRTEAAETAQVVNLLLQAWGVPPRISFATDLHSELDKQNVAASHYGTVSRRAFFDLLARETKRVTAATVASVIEETRSKPPEQPRGEPKGRASPKRQMLVRSLRRLGTPSATTLRTPLWAQFGFTDKCVGCQMCAFFCPTGALTKAERDGQVGVAFKVADCTNCGLCQQVCHWGAVTLSYDVDLARVMNGTAETLSMVSEQVRAQLLSPDERLKQMFAR